MRASRVCVDYGVREPWVEERSLRPIIDGMLHGSLSRSVLLEHVLCAEQGATEPNGAMNVLAFTKQKSTLLGERAIMFVS